MFIVAVSFYMRVYKYRDEIAKTDENRYLTDLPALLPKKSSVVEVLLEYKDRPVTSISYVCAPGSGREATLEAMPTLYWRSPTPKAPAKSLVPNALLPESSVAFTPAAWRCSSICWLRLSSGRSTASACAP